MPAGRPPTPTGLLKLRGAYRGDRHGDRAEPALPAGAPSCPTWLDAEAKAEWKRQVAGLEAAGLVAKVDRALLTAWCRAWSTFVHASREIEQHGYEYCTGKTVVVMPEAQPHGGALKRTVQVGKSEGRKGKREQPPADGELLIELKERPAVARMFRAIDKLERLAAKFGFSPVDRARIKAPPRETAHNGKDRFFKGSRA